MDDYLYQPPVDQFLSRGCPDDFEPWDDYLPLGFREEHVPELLRMATDRRLLEADSKSDEVMAPMHAWRTLGQLGAEAVVEPLLELLAERGDEGVHEDLPGVCGMVGPAAIPPLAAHLGNETFETFVRSTAGRALTEIAKEHPEARDRCVAELVTQVARYLPADPEANAFLIGELMTMKATGALPVIREAYSRQIVADYILNLNRVEVELGVREPESPAPKTAPAVRSASNSNPAPVPNSEKRKKKQKRKAAAKSRKQARRRK